MMPLKKGLRRYSLVQKHHKLNHLLAQAHHIHPASAWCYGSESFMGIIKQISSSCTWGTPAHKVTGKVLMKFRLVFHLLLKAIQKSGYHRLLQKSEKTLPCCAASWIAMGCRLGWTALTCFHNYLLCGLGSPRFELVGWTAHEGWTALTCFHKYKLVGWTALELHLWA